MEKGVGKEVAKQYNIAAYPTLGYFDGDGRMVWRVAGALEADEFIALGQKVLDGVEPVQDMYDTYASGKYSKDFLYKYLVHMHESGMNYREALTEYADEMDPEELNTEQGWDVFHRFFQRIDSDAFDYFEKHRKELAEKHGEDVVNEKYYGMHISALGQAAYKKDAEQVAAISKVLEGNGGEKIQWDYHGIMIRWIMDSESEEDGYRTLTEWVQEGKPLHWSTLNQYAWGVYEKSDDPAHIDMALSWINSSIEKDRNYFNLDTQAMLYHKGGNTARAIEVAREAIDAAKESGDDYEATEKELNKWLEE